MALTSRGAAFGPYQCVSASQVISAVKPCAHDHPGGAV